MEIDNGVLLLGNIFGSMVLGIKGLRKCSWGKFRQAGVTARSHSLLVGALAIATFVGWLRTIGDAHHGGLSILLLVAWGMFVLGWRLVADRDTVNPNLVRGLVLTPMLMTTLGFFF